MVYIIILILSIICLTASYYIFDKKNKHKTIVDITRAILVILILELSIFNMNSYRLVFGDFEHLKYTVQNIKIEDGLTQEDGKYITTKEITKKVEIDNINKEIGTIKLNIDTNRPIEYKIYYTDETSAEYRDLPSKTLVNEIENSKSIPTYLSGTSKKILVELKIPANTTFKIDSIELNSNIEFNFNIVRVLLLFLGWFFLYAMKNFEEFNIPYTKKNKLQLLVIIYVTLLAIWLVYWITDTSLIKTEDKTNDYITPYMGQAVDMVLDGKVYLEQEPSKELMNLSNPYDNTLRNAENVDYVWDMAYYNGKYYVYFGILPVLTVMAPYKFITGDYMELNTVVFIFATLTIIFIMKSIMLIFRRWFKDVPFKFLILFFVAVISGGIIMWICRRPITYEVAIISGYYLVIQGIFFILKTIEKQKVNYIYMCLACLSLALAVACRPNLLIASLLIVPVLLKIFINNIKNRENILKNILVVAIPYGIVGISLMLYNYVRFDNIFEFGAQYQITVNDMRNLGNRIMTIPIGLMSYLFKIPTIISQFPFAQISYDTITFYGYYWSSAMAGGIFILSPICFALFLIPKIRKKINKELFFVIIMLSLVGIIICILDIVLGGNSQRYAADYAWMFLFAGMMTIMAIYQIIKNEKIKHYIYKVTLVLVVFSGIINFLLGGIQSEDNYLKSYYPEQYYGIRYGISFWE